jgi:hypothetical protein
MVDEKRQYPLLAVSTWWKLREKFKQSIPGIVTDSYLATTLTIDPSSAKNNIIPNLKLIGLIDEEGKTNQELAKSWRDDGHYTDVCKKIVEQIYPSELVEAVHSPSEDRGAVERWFSIHTGLGQSAVKKMSSFYIALSEADVSKRPERKPKEQPAKKIKIAQPKPDQPRQHVEQAHEPSTQRISPDFPNLNINLQIHISSDASPDQIDKIFESMAKHIYKK